MKNSETELKIKQLESWIEAQSKKIRMLEEEIKKIKEQIAQKIAQKRLRGWL